MASKKGLQDGVIKGRENETSVTFVRNKFKMALNLNDKKYLSEQILPEVNFNITTTGITILAGERLSTPRFLPFDQQGKCSHCKSTEAEIDFVVTKEGVTVFCSRIKGSRFVPFDYARDLPGFTFFRIKNKGRIFNINHGFPPEQCVPAFGHPVEKSKKPVEVEKVAAEKQESSQPPPSMKRKQQQDEDLLEGLTTAATLVSFIGEGLPKPEVGHPQQQQQQQNLLEGVSTAVTLASFLEAGPPPPPPMDQPKEPIAATQQQQQQQDLHSGLATLATLASFFGENSAAAQPVEQPAEGTTMEEDLDEFFGSLNAATAGLPEKDEETEAIASITPKN